MSIFSNTNVWIVISVYLYYCILYCIPWWATCITLEVDHMPSTDAFHSRHGFQDGFQNDGQSSVSNRDEGEIYIQIDSCNLITNLNKKTKKSIVFKMILYILILVYIKLEYKRNKMGEDQLMKQILLNVQTNMQNLTKESTNLRKIYRNVE